ncbi:MAG: tetratricopeptide repeat protein [Chloroflexota bacterium]
MAKVSLRSYNRDIEALIENEQVAEAVAHCQHILKTFPKHLETYRLLGKAYLEARRYADAADIFQRVLMAVPDDFVSHVGMSIIRDDEKKLEEAIWHMERAFEAQPSNAAVQGELRRLYGRRDGMEPPKVRMTRGALAHMYVQGQLFSQAIAEIRAVLADDPQRVDMQALLAKAYFFGGHRAETIELCTTLLKKYPYSFEANRIMVEILPSTGRAESTQVYRHRVNQLDPYAAFATGSTFELAAVPDAAINLERLEYEPGQAEPLESGWASSLGINLESERPETPPAWLTASSYDEEEKPAALPEATPNTSEDIPDFLREAGWTPATGEFKEGPMELGGEGEESEGAELTPADIPDWLQSMAPEESEPEETAQADLEFLSTARPAAPSEDIPDWLKNVAPVEATEPAMRNTPDEDATPDWLNLGEEPSPEAAAEPGPDSGIPAQGVPPAGGVGEGALEIPDWLGDLSAAEPGESAEAQEPAEAAADLPDWMGEMPAIEQAVTPEEPAAPGGIAGLGTSAEEQDAALAWLESLAAKQGANEEELLVKPEERLDSAPEWVDKFQAAAGEPAPEAEAEPEQPEAAEAPAEAAIPDWLGELPGMEQPTEAGEPAAPEAELPSWLAGELETETPAPADEPVAFVAGEPGQTKVFETGEEPSDLMEEPAPEVSMLEDTQETRVAAEAELPESLSETPVPFEAAAAPVSGPGTTADEQDAALAWLESLAAKQGANEEELLVKPEDRRESAPDWVDQVQAEAEPVAAPEPPVEAAEAEMPDFGSLPSFEEEMEPPLAGVMPEAAVPAVIPEDDLTEWLKELDQAETEESAPAVPEASEVSFDWLKEDQPAAEELGSVTDWLQSLDEQAKAETLVEPAAAEEEKVPELPTWLQEEGPARAGMDEDLPDWLRGEEAEAEKPAPTTPAEWQPAAEQEPAPPSFEVETPAPEPPKPEAPVEEPVLRASTPIPTMRRTGMLGPTKDILLLEAQTELQRGNLQAALDTYGKMIKKNRLLDEVIYDLREATYRYPVDVAIWQALGDAYMRSNRLQDALDAYTKAEELLR